MDEAPEAILARHRWRAIGLLAPGAIVSYRTALRHAPEQDGTVFLVGRTRYDRDLPGLKIRVAKGPDAQPGDFDMVPGLKIASRPRALLEALASGAARGVQRDEAEALLEKAFQTGGEQAVNRFRNEARTIAPALGAEAEFALLDQIAGAILGSRSGPVATPSAVARLTGAAYDVNREALFQSLFAALRDHEPPERRWAGDRAAFATAAFFDAYFSNFIEGTEFEVEEARAIVFEGHIPAERPSDAHDVLGTYAIVGSAERMARSVTTLSSFDAFVEQLWETHRTIMTQRADKRPGEFKTRRNRAGDSQFVSPEHVRGTLRIGFDLARALPHAFQRAIALTFVVTEVHPFDDGNGRVARALMNAELVADKQARIIIPTVYRDEYLQGLRNLTRQHYSETLIAVLDFAQRWTAAVDWSDFARAEQQLTACHAFERPRSDVKLIMPDG
jgi:Fic family protein